jgi:hypothetical protein
MKKLFLICILVILIISGCQPTYLHNEVEIKLTKVGGCCVQVDVTSDICIFTDMNLTLDGVTEIYLYPVKDDKNIDVNIKNPDIIDLSIKILHDSDIDTSDMIMINSNEYFTKDINVKN